MVYKDKDPIQTMVSGILLSLGTGIWDPYLDVVYGAYV